MKKLFLRISACLLVACMLFTVNAFAFEGDQSSISPRWVSIFDIDLTLTFHGEVGCVTGSASKMSTASLIEGTLYMYENVDGEWVYINEAYKSKAVGGLGISFEFDVESGVEYKAVFVVTAYTGGVPETETVESIKTCP